ncbi:ribonuclease III [Candidatus Berkelbacteria bacterium]|nr:ribonuclease III [Candidatus Berkelbacteria bacterium]
MMSNFNFAELEEKIGVKFNNQDLLKQVFIHRSYINESGKTPLEHNERLEFLGDAVLELVVTEYLYNNFSNPEGELTNWRSSIVRGEVLAKVSTQLDLGSLLFLSKGEEKSGGRERNLILANTFEALIGAIYLDQKYDAASKFIHRFLIVLLPEIIEKKLYIDPKSHLQEISQEKLGVTPEYRVISHSGPDHNKLFVVGVFARERELAQGQGSSKQRAEQDAATNALSNWKD